MAAEAGPVESRKFPGDAGDTILSLAGRLFLAAIFLVSGVGKVAAPAATAGFIASVGLPWPHLGLALAVVLELGGGLALLLGYRTRLVAAGLALFCLGTAAIFHSDFGDQNQLIHFLKNVAMCGGLLQVLAFGAGRLSLDARQRAP